MKTASRKQRQECQTCVNAGHATQTDKYCKERPVGEEGRSGPAAEGRGEVSISFRNVEGEAQVSGLRHNREGSQSTRHPRKQTGNNARLCKVDAEGPW